MFRECFSLFTALFNHTVAEETYIIGQKDAEVIWRSGLIPITHEKTSGKRCMEMVWQ